MGKKQWRDAGQVLATDSAGRRHTITEQTEWHEVTSLLDTAPTWADSGFKRYRLATGAPVTRRDDGSFVVPATGAVLQPV